MEKLHTYISLYLPIGITLLGAWLAYRRYLKERSDNRDLIVNAIFGDLANLVEHYTYASNELDLALGSTEEKNTRIRMSQFGTLRSIDKIELLGNLSTTQIRELLQINLRVRNTDQILEDLLKIDKLTSSELERVKVRMSYCISSSAELLESIAKSRSDLKTEYESLRKRFPV